MDLIGRVNAGYTIIAAVQFPHPGDSHLYVVMGQQDNAFVVWTFNTQDGGFYHGHYFGHPKSDNRWLAFSEFMAMAERRHQAYRIPAYR
jgi:hypothetical protein